MPPNIDIAAEDCTDYRICTFEGFSPVCRGNDFGGIISCGDDFIDSLAYVLKPFRVDIHEDNSGILEQFKCKDVLDESSGESETSGTYETNASHMKLLFWFKC
jgi:isopentenyl phosphate kinase